MGAQLNIKNGEARLLAEAIAGATGESITEAVTKALRTRWHDIRRHEAQDLRSRRPREEAFYAIVDGSRARWPDHQPSIDHGDLLYDQYGLPR